MIYHWNLLDRVPAEAGQRRVVGNVVAFEEGPTRILQAVVRHIVHYYTAEGMHAIAHEFHLALR
jgi:hypothetical protein